MSTISITALVATTPRHLVTQDGLPITSFRVVEQVSKTSPNLDPASTQYLDNWFTVTAFHSLAINTAGSVSKGDRIVVTGNLRIRDWDNGERNGTFVEIEATSIGHDLSRGTSTFKRTLTPTEVGA